MAVTFLILNIQLLKQTNNNKIIEKTSTRKIIKDHEKEFSISNFIEKC